MRPYWLLVGFGPACAPVRCAHPSFLVHCHPLSPPIAASLLLISPQKIHKIYPTWAAHVKDFFLSTVPQRQWDPCPPSRASQLWWFFRQYFGVKSIYRCDHTHYFFSVFLFFSFWIFFFCVSLLFLLSFSISSYSSLISSYSSRRAILRLLILLLLYFKLFIVLQTCIIIIFLFFSTVLHFILPVCCITDMHM